MFSENIYSTGDYLRSDTIHQNLPFKYIYYQELHEGTLPFWTDLIYGGFPLFAEGQVGALYPVNLIFYSILPFVRAYNYTQIANFLIASFGFYFLARTFKISKASSTIFSIVFGISSFFVLHITHQNIVAAASWIPFMFLGIRNIKKGILYNVLFIVALTSSLLAGSMQITFYALFMISVYVFIFVDKKYWKYYFLNFMIMTVTAIGLASPQLLPTYELVKESTRTSGLGTLTLESLPYHPRNIVTLVLPYIFGDPGVGTYPKFGNSWGMFWENTIYIGLLPLIFAFATFRYFKIDKIIKRLWIFLGISYLLVLGKYSPLFFVHLLAGFNDFRVTARFSIFVTLALVLLAGFSLDKLIKRFKDNLFLGFIIFIIFITTIFDLFVFGYSYNPVISASSILEKPELVRNIDDKDRIMSVGSFLTYDQMNKDGWRKNNEYLKSHINLSDPNVNMLWGVSNIEGYSGLNLSRQDVYKNELYRGFKVEANTIEISDESLTLLGLRSVNYLTSDYELINKNIEKLSSDDSYFNLYKNKLYIKSPFLFNGSLSRSEAVFEPKDILDAFTIETISESDLFKKYRVTSEKEAWFYFSQSYYPGWSASVNAINSTIYPVNTVDSAFKVPQGESEVVLSYIPNKFRLGRMIGIFTMLAMLLYLILKKRIDK